MRLPLQLHSHDTTNNYYLMTNIGSRCQFSGEWLQQRRSIFVIKLNANFSALLPRPIRPASDANLSVVPTIYRESSSCLRLFLTYLYAELIWRPARATRFVDRPVASAILSRRDATHSLTPRWWRQFIEGKQWRHENPQLLGVVELIDVCVSWLLGQIRLSEEQSWQWF